MIIQSTANTPAHAHSYRPAPSVGKQANPPKHPPGAPRPMKGKDGATISKIQQRIMTGSNNHGQLWSTTGNNRRSPCSVGIASRLGTGSGTTFFMTQGEQSPPLLLPAYPSRSERDAHSHIAVSKLVVSPDNNSVMLIKEAKIAGSSAWPASQPTRRLVRRCPHAGQRDVYQPRGLF